MMKRATTALMLGLSLGATLPADARDTPLSGYRWKNRVLVVMAPARQDDNLVAQRRIFESNATGMAERQIVLIEVTGNDDRARAIRNQLGADDRSFRVLLVGKDGNTAASSTRPFSAAELFGKVDAMPMRRDEMRR